MKFNFIIIPLITIVTCVLGARATSQGMNWYQRMNIPAWTPPGKLISLIWLTIYSLTTIAALIFYNTFEHDFRFWFILIIFIANALFNGLWSWIFFRWRQVSLAIFDAFLMFFTVLLLMVLVRSVNQWVSVLLAPYAVWAAFVTYLNFEVWRLNK